MHIQLLIGALSLLVAGCTIGGISSTKLDDSSYRVAVSACMGKFKDAAEKAKLEDKLRRESARLCRPRSATTGELEVVMKGTGGYGAVFGECPIFSLEANVTCQEGRSP